MRDTRGTKEVTEDKLFILFVGIVIGVIVYSMFDMMYVYNDARKGIREPSADCKEIEVKTLQIW